VRPIETLLGWLVLSTALLSTSGRGKGVAGILTAASMLVLGVHLIGEGPRLMATPIYLAVCALAVGQAFPTSRSFSTVSACLASACATIGLLACYKNPIVSFPKPLGPYAIGTQTFYFTDPNRVEEYGVTPGQRRRFVAQIWYPALASKAAPARYLESNELSWRKADLRYVKTNSRANAPIVQTHEHFPVVLFSPASGGYRSQNTYLTEFLVSYGYVVIAFDHPNSCARVAFPDGSVMKGLPDSWLNLDSRAALERSSIKCQKILKTNVQDIQYFLDQLMLGTKDNRLARIAEEMDLSRVAALGHSFGGAVAAELCRKDPRVQIGINMDGWMFGDVNKDGIPKRFLFLIEDDPLWFKNEGPYPDNFDGLVRWGTRQYHDSIKRDLALWGAHVGMLRGAEHSDFADTPLFEAGWPWDPKRALPVTTLHRTVSEVVLAFLDDSFGRRPHELLFAATELKPYFRFWAGGLHESRVSNNRESSGIFEKL
jgi:pimeloyl-ACP methyl ester carboxylesterase